LNRGSADDQRDSARLLLQAVTLDPGFALAHGRLAETYINLGNFGFEPREKVYPLAKASAERALALDERNVQAHTALGEYAFHYAWEWEESDRHLRRALAIDPNYFPAVSHQGSHDMARNRTEDALASLRKARELNPLGSSTAILSALIRSKRYDEAIQLGRQEVAAHPAWTGPRVQLAMAQFLNGQQAEGLRALEAIVKPEQAGVRELSRLGWCYGIAGQKEKARAILKRLQDAEKTQRAAPDFAATVHVGLGEHDQAFELLERAYAQREPSMPLIGSEYLFDPIRDDPRFRSLLKRMKLDAYFPEAPVR
jgi:tetratricopeptide (TPR) repeat protein